MLDMLKEAVNSAVEPVKYFAGDVVNNATAIATNTTVIEQAVEAVESVEPGWFAWAYDNMYEGLVGVVGAVTLGAAYKKREDIVDTGCKTLDLLKSFRRHQEKAKIENVELQQEEVIADAKVEEIAVSFDALKAALMDGEKALSLENADAIIAKLNDHQDKFDNKAFFDAFVENMQTKSEKGIADFIKAKPVVINVVLNQIQAKSEENKAEDAPKVALKV